MPDVTGDNRKANGQFKPGVSGNPNGRPKGSQSIPDILRKIGDEEGTTDGKSKLDVVMYKVFQYALEGKSWAVQFIADRTEGKALERVEQHVTKDEIIIE
jgi:hypothetical protein|tara:strand:+ start:191 stop:490 length:300 start_codon:yes stop_codon:yes gene_type:complete